MRFASEEQLQAYCFQWFWNTFPAERQMLFHVDNNSSDKWVGNKKKALGVTRGVADFIFFLRDGRSVAIEMKLPGGTQSKQQEEFMYKIQERRHLYFLCFGFEEFEDLIYTLLS